MDASAGSGRSPLEKPKLFAILRISQKVNGRRMFRSVHMKGNVFAPHRIRRVAEVTVFIETLLESRQGMNCLSGRVKKAHYISDRTRLTVTARECERVFHQ